MNSEKYSRSSKNLKIRKFELISPDGVFHQGENLSTFAKEKGLRVSKLCSVVNKQLHSYKGWTTPDGKPVIEKRTHYLLSPEGKVFEVSNLNAFAKEHNVQALGLSRLTRGQYSSCNNGKVENKNCKSYKGWTVASAELIELFKTEINSTSSKISPNLESEICPIIPTITQNLEILPNLPSQNLPNLQIKIGSICSGMGMALHGLGTNVWGIECDNAIADIYIKNHPHSRMICDYVQNVDPNELEDVDCIIATPSCRNASIANSKAGETEDDLIVAKSIVNILKTKLPKFFILENVRGYRSFESFAQIEQALTNQGYYITSQILNLKDFGIAQNRERMYLLAVRNQMFWDIQPPQIKQLGWHDAIADLIPTLPEIFLSKYQQNCKGITSNCLIRRIGANRANNRAYQPSEPSFTIRAFGRKADNHWNQANILIDNIVKSVTPRACLRFFGDKETADKIWLPERKTLAMEVVGNGASWGIMQFLLTHLTQ